VNAEVLDVFEAIAAHGAGKLSDTDLAAPETAACPSAGSRVGVMLGWRVAGQDV